MLTFLTIAQLVLYVALLALAGQGVLYVLAGSKRETNIFYTLLRVISKPFTWPVRKITPPQVADRHVPVVTFFLLLVVYGIVTFERMDLCVTSGLVGQPGCR
jgi:cytochrome b561